MLGSAAVGPALLVLVLKALVKWLIAPDLKEKKKRKAPRAKKRAGSGRGSG